MDFVLHNPFVIAANMLLWPTRTACHLGAVSHNQRPFSLAGFSLFIEG